MFVPVQVDMCALGEFVYNLAQVNQITGMGKKWVG